MIRYEITHPELLQALAEAGHGAQILLADSNYPVTAKCGPKSRIVYVNIAPGLVSGTDMVRLLAGAIPIESVVYMTPDDGSTPAIISEYRALIGEKVPFGSCGRFAFYDRATGPDTTLVIATGEQRTYACLLLTVGVIAG